MISESGAWRLANALPISDFTLLCYIAECGLSGSNGQAHNLKIWMDALDHAFGPQTVFACPLNLLYLRIQQNGAWKEIGGAVIEMLVSVPQTHEWWL